MKNAIAIFCAAFCLARAACAVTMASQPWTTNRIAEAEARIASNIVEAIDAIPAPDFSQNNAQLRETIVAVSPPADLTDATNHTRAALSAFAGTGTVARATAYGTPTRWTDATGGVWEVVFPHFTDWIFSGVPSGYSFYLSEYNGELPGWNWALERDGGGDYEQNDYFSEEGTETTLNIQTAHGTVTCTREWIDAGTNYVGRIALTNDIPDVSGYATQQQATNAAVVVADAKISTNNAAFVAAVTNCPVSHQGGGGADWPIGDFGQYGTIGAIIAALVAASTWLKSHLRYELHDVVLTGGAGTLLDRAGNRVEVSGDTTLTLPAANPGYLRDFLVRLAISGSTVPTITFAAPNGETLTYETDGDEFPVPDEAGDWLYSFTESCVAHKFAVSLKKVNEVAAPQTQGGS